MSIGVMVDNDDLIQTVFDGLPSSWESFLVVLNAREVQPNFERLWHDCLQEEWRIQSKTSFFKEKITLMTRMKRGKKSFPQKRFPRQKEKTFNRTLIS